MWYKMYHRNNHYRFNNIILLANEVVYSLTQDIIMVVKEFTKELIKFVKKWGIVLLSVRLDTLYLNHSINHRLMCLISFNHRNFHQMLILIHEWTYLNLKHICLIWMLYLSFLLCLDHLSYHYCCLLLTHLIWWLMILILYLY